MAALALLIPLALAQTEVQTVVVNASVGGLTPTAVIATVQQAGERHELRLVDDGTDPNDARGDRVYTGTLEGSPAQYLTIGMAVEIDGERRDVYAGTLRVGMERSLQVAFEVTTGPDGKLMGVRRASAAPGRMSHATEVVPLMAATFWAVVVLVLGAVSLRLREP